MLDSSRRRKKGAEPKGSSTSSPGAINKAAKDRSTAKEVKSTKWLDKLPKEVWEKIFDNLDENDLFPLALSCRYFRQKQKELVARTRQSGRESGKPRLALRTNLERKLDDEDQPASAEYLRFCYKEKEETSIDDDYHERVRAIRDMAAFHGYLPLLQPLAKSLRKANSLGDIAEYAGKSHYHILSIIIVFLLFVSASDFFFSLLRSARRSTGDLAVAENPGAVQAG